MLNLFILCLGLTSNMPHFENIQNVSFDGSMNSGQVSNLQSGASYLFQMAASSDSGPGPLSDPIQQTYPSQSSPTYPYITTRFSPGVLFLIEA